MCGIAGFINAEGILADAGTLRRMASVLRHRGPDGEGFWLEGRAGLGHRRLSIIDIAGGTQPMANEDGSVWVTFNGEIYNEPELRDRLIAKGHRFATQSDTECLVHLYEEFGPDFVPYLNGMFAFGIWDKNRDRLLLARDRMGQKPLYWHLSSRGTFVFASEPKAILEHPEYHGSIDQQGLAEYLFYEYLPFERSIWQGIHKLMPGHMLVFDRGQVQVSRYWKADVAEEGLDLDDEYPANTLPANFWNRFREAVGRHQRSDVPLGVFLSGGVDSSAVAAALVELQGPDRVKTFSIGFEDRSFDESGHARLVAKHLGTRHHERVFSVGRLTDLLPELCNWLDEPFGDASVLPTHLLSAFAREHVTVALGGDGADELMAGYPTFKAESWLRRYQKLPPPLRRIMAAAVRRLPVRHTNFSLDFKAKQFLRGAESEPALAHQRWLGSFASAEINQLMLDMPGMDVEAGFIERLMELRKQDYPSGMSAADERLLQYQATYLPEDILFKVDRASMASSLEVRAPFLDAELVDWLAAMPYQYKFQAGVGKLLLKKAMQGRIPESIMQRPKKGFGIPVAAWLRGPLRGWMTDLLADSRIRSQGLFRPEFVNRLVDEHLRGVKDHRKPLWTLLIFQMWYDRWAVRVRS
jgi:asparagine synthase (glutamine-hydrolysing)